MLGAASGVVGGAERDEHRREVLDGRVRVAAPTAPGAEVDQLVDVAARAAPRRPTRRTPPTSAGGAPAAVAEVHERQAVGEEPGPDDQHALVAQRGEPAAELEQPLRVERRHRDLQHRDVRVRVHHRQRDVRAVVEAASRLLGDLLVVGHQRADARGQLGRAGRVVA